jgi:hypothetical protein
MEKVAEIRAVFIQYPFGLSLATVVINSGIVICTIEATMQIGCAVWTLLLPADNFSQFNFLAAVIANCHTNKHIDDYMNSQE